MKVDLKTIMLLVAGWLLGWFTLGMFIPNWIAGIIGAVILMMMFK